MRVTVFGLVLGSLLPLTSHGLRAQTRQPVIDVHLHAEGVDAYIATRDSTWWVSEGLHRPADDQMLLEASLSALSRNNIVAAITSEDLDSVDRWRRAAPDRIIPALLCAACYEPQEIDSIRAWAASGRLRVLGEMVWQYLGRTPSHPELDPFWALAEELDLPVGVHMGLTPPGWSQTVDRNLRIANGRPTTLEDVLVRHPDVRVYIMHAGWPFLDDMVAMLHQYPGLYVDVSWINWYLPRAEFHSYLRRLTDAGFAGRIMFGSDQMQWPEKIDVAIESIEQAPFLTRAQKRDILCRNAAAFFRLDAGLCVI